MKPKEEPKAVTGHQSNAWPYAWEDIDDFWALEAIRHGNGSILARYLREVKEIDPRVCRALAEMLRPNSKHIWRLYAEYRFRGKPSKQATESKSAFIAALPKLAMQISKTTNPIDATIRRSFANMLDPESRHPLYLEFRRRKRGTPPRKDPWLLAIPINLDLAIRLAKKSGHRVKLFERALPDQKKMSRSTYYRRRKQLGLSRKSKKTIRSSKK
jgi:hypothetical protein